MKSVYEEGEELVEGVLVKRQEASDKNLREYEEYREGEVVSFVERTELARNLTVQIESNKNNIEIRRVKKKQMQNTHDYSLINNKSSLKQYKDQAAGYPMSTE